LETIVLDWLGRFSFFDLSIFTDYFNLENSSETGQMIGLPADFLSFTENSKGGGVMQVAHF
jgi:hypothetical protein